MNMHYVSPDVLETDIKNIARQSIKWLWQNVGSVDGAEPWCMNRWSFLVFVFKKCRALRGGSLRQQTGWRSRRCCRRRRSLMRRISWSRLRLGFGLLRCRLDLRLHWPSKMLFVGRFRSGRGYAGSCWRLRLRMWYWRCWMGGARLCGWICW